MTDETRDAARALAQMGTPGPFKQGSFWEQEIRTSWGSSPLVAETCDYRMKDDSDNRVADATKITRLLNLLYNAGNEDGPLTEYLDAVDDLLALRYEPYDHVESPAVARLVEARERLTQALRGES